MSANEIDNEQEQTGLDRLREEMGRTAELFGVDNPATEKATPVATALSDAQATLADLPGALTKVGAITLFEEEKLLDAITRSDWAAVGELAAKYDLALTPQDVVVLSRMGGAAGELAKASAQFARDLPRIIAANSDSESASEDMVKALLVEFVELVDDGLISNESLKALVSIALPEYADKLIALVRGKAEDAAATMLTDLIVDKLALGGGKSGYDPKVSWLISVLYSMLPDEGKAALKGALIGATTAKAVKDNKMVGFVDAVGVLLQALGLGDMPSAALYDHQYINGIGWTLVPFSSGFIGISDRPVQGPDIRIFWNKWNPATKQALKAADMIPVVGDTIVDLVNGSAQYLAYTDFINSLKEVSGSPDTLKDILATVAKKGLTRLASAAHSAVEDLFSRTAQRIREAHGRVSGRLRSWFQEQAERIVSASAAIIQPTSTSSEASMPLTQPSASRVSPPQATADVEGLLALGRRPDVEKTTHASLPGVEPWINAADDDAWGGE